MYNVDKTQEDLVYYDGADVKDTVLLYMTYCN